MKRKCHNVENHFCFVVFLYVCIYCSKILKCYLEDACGKTHRNRIFDKNSLRHNLTEKFKLGFGRPGRWRMDFLLASEELVFVLNEDVSIPISQETSLIDTLHKKHENIVNKNQNDMFSLRTEQRVLFWFEFVVSPASPMYLISKSPLQLSTWPRSGQPNSL